MPVPKNFPMHKHQIFYKLNSAYIQDTVLRSCLYCVIEQVTVFFHQIILVKGFGFDKTEEV